MSPHRFGVHSGDSARLKPRTRRVYERVAREYGATLVEAVMPGRGYVRWFECPNHGEPFNTAAERAVYAAIATKLGGAR